MTHSSEEERKGIGYADERSVHDTPNSPSPHPPIEAIERLKEAAEDKTPPAGHATDHEAWREFSGRYGPMSREQLCMGVINDFALANAQYFVHRDSLDLLAHQTAAKDRIRWLSVQLAQSQASLSQAQDRIKELEGEIARLEGDGVRQVKEVITLRRARGPGIARLMAAPAVLIQSDNGWWRANGCGYTDQSRAAVYTGADAYNRTKHCGPEKAVRYHVLGRALSTPKGSDEA